MSIHGISATHVQVTVDMSEAHLWSLRQLSEFEAKDAEVGTAAVGSLLTVGRILSPDKLTEEQEVVFIKEAMEWLGMYFAGGRTDN